MKFRVLLISTIFLFNLIPGTSLSQSKVVVIPLESDSNQLDPETLRALCRSYDVMGTKPPAKYDCPPKLVFITSEAYDGNLGGVLGADYICQYHADRSVLTRGRKFKAWLSDTWSSPAFSFVRSQTPYMLTCQTGDTGGVIANNWDDLTTGDGDTPNHYLDAPIIYSEEGCSNSVESVSVWSNTNPDGKIRIGDRDYICKDWSYDDPLPITNGLTGWNMSTIQYWTWLDHHPCNERKHLYCFEQ